MPRIAAADLFYGVCAFYSVLNALYLALGVYNLTSVTGANGLLAAPDDIAHLALVGLGAGGAAAAAAGFVAARKSSRVWLSSIVQIAAFVFFAVNFALFQRPYVAGQIALSTALIGALPSLVLLLWTAIAAERSAHAFSGFNARIDSLLFVQGKRRIFGIRVATWMLLLVGALTLSSFVTLTLNQYWRLQPRYDTAVFENIFYHTLRGQIGWETIDRVNHLGVHFTPTLSLLLPIYAVLPHATTLLVVESILLVAGAIPLWFLAKRVTGSTKAAYVFAVGYWCFPHIIGTNVHGFKELCAWPLLGFWYLILHEDDKFYRRPMFWIVFVLACGLKEEFAVTIAAISFVHVLQGRVRNWNAVVIGICVVYFFGITKVAMPVILGPAGHPEYGKGWLFAFYYEDMLPQGHHTFTGYVINAVLHPQLVASMLGRTQDLNFLLDISATLAFLPWLGGLNLLSVLPSLFLTNLLASRTGALSTLSTYITYVVPWFYCAMYGWVRVRKPFFGAAGLKEVGLYVMLFLSLGMLTQTVRFAKPIPASTVDLRLWLEAQPENLRVMATRCFLPVLSRRDTIRTIDASDDLNQLDLIIVQSEQHYCTWTNDNFPAVQKAVLANGDFAEAPSPEPGIVVYRRIRPAAQPGHPNS